MRKNTSINKSVYKKISKSSDFKKMSDDEKIHIAQLCLGLEHIFNRIDMWKTEHFKSGKEESSFNYTQQMLISDTPDCNQDERDLISSLMGEILNNE